MTDKEMLEWAAKAAGKKITLDPIGEIYGRLTVVSEVARKNPRKRRFQCKCTCGNETEVDLNKLRTGYTRSCGCLHLETIAKNLANHRHVSGTIKHGMNKTPEHRSWVHMRQRCGNPKKKEYPHYGGRGIKVCEQWQKSFKAFYADVGPRPSPKHSLDRIDVNGNYEPGNVRWATQQQQVENTRVARHITIDGKTQTLSAWAREVGLSAGRICGRLAAGWTEEEAILKPSVPGQKVHMTVKRDYSQRSRDWHGRYQAEITRTAAEIGKARKDGE